MSAWSSPSIPLLALGTIPAANFTGAGVKRCNISLLVDREGDRPVSSEYFGTGKNLAWGCEAKYVTECVWLMCRRYDRRMRSFGVVSSKEFFISSAVFYRLAASSQQYSLERDRKKNKHAAYTQIKTRQGGNKYGIKNKIKCGDFRQKCLPPSNGPADKALQRH